MVMWQVNKKIFDKKRQESITKEIPKEVVQKKVIIRNEYPIQNRVRQITGGSINTKINKIMEAYIADSFLPGARNNWRK